MPQYLIHAWDERRQRWRPRRDFQRYIDRAVVAGAAQDAVELLVPALARQHQLRLRLVQMIAVAGPQACLRVERIATRDGTEWRLDVALTTRLGNAISEARHTGRSLDPDAWLLDRTWRRMAFQYRIATD